MRVLLFLLACTVLQLVSPGQSFDWVSGDTISVALEPNTYAELKMRQNNLTTDTLNLGVEIIHKDIPESWDGMVCLQGLCLGLIPEEREKYTMLPLHGEQKGFVRLTINPYDGTEQAKLRIRVYDIDRPIYSDTATWLLNSNTLGIKKLMDENTLEIYPNPTRGPYNLKSSTRIDCIKVINSLGLMVQETFTIPSTETRVDISSLSSGVYKVITYYQGNPTGVKKITLL